MTEDYLLHTPLARRLYHECAADLPIIDYHNHLETQDLAEDRCFENLTRLWIAADPYKHRALRICGVPERLITGNASDEETFEAFMKVLPKLAGNVLYDWSMLELARVFDIDLAPHKTDPRAVWNAANAKLRQPGFSAQGLLAGFRVEYLAPCTPVDGCLAPFAALDIAAPSLRGDSLLALTADTVHAVERLTGIDCRDLDGFTAALSHRLDAFARAGCRFADHALDEGFMYYPDDGANPRRYAQLLRGKLEPDEQPKLSCELLRRATGEYATRNWTLQLHIGALRFTSTRLRAIAGPAGGFAAIGGGCDLRGLARMLDDFEKSDTGLPRIVLFTLNPADSAALAALSGSYCRDGVAGTVGLGPAWWWNDHLPGIRQALETVSAYGVLSAFIGMTTDSRSLLSLTRHEYFRRVLCGWLGDKAARGEMPDDPDALEPIVRAVCYENAKEAVGI